MKNKVVGIGMIGIILFAVCMLEGQRQEAQNDVEIAEHKNSYYVQFLWIDKKGDDSEKRYGQRIVWLMTLDAFPERHRENINRMLIEEAESRLPDGAEEEWWDAASIYIDYRSDKYLFWHYISSSPLPQECKWEDLYFGLDIEEGKLLEHSHDVYLYSWQDEEKPYLKMEESWKRTVKEQIASYRTTAYELLETQGECDGAVFPVVKVTGMANEVVQKRINEQLQEGLRKFIENEGWRDNEYRQDLLDKTKIYISYKSDRLLSVVYSIPITDPNELDDGILDLPIVLDMQTGERLKLDDLIDVEELKYWLVCRVSLPIDFKWQWNGILSQERELFYGNSVNWYMEFSDYSALERFYLDQGRLILLEYQSDSDDNIPLSEMFGYLKADPWYE